MNDETIEQALAEIRGSACVSEDVEHWTGTVRDILTRLVATTREQARRQARAEFQGTQEALAWAMRIVEEVYATSGATVIPPGLERARAALSQIPPEGRGQEEDNA
jgi:hypothetical protein